MAITNLPKTPRCIPWMNYEDLLWQSAKMGTIRPKEPCNKTDTDPDCNNDCPCGSVS